MKLMNNKIKYNKHNKIKILYKKLNIRIIVLIIFKILNIIIINKLM